VTPAAGHIVPIRAMTPRSGERNRRLALGWRLKKLSPLDTSLVRDRSDVGAMTRRCRDAENVVSIA
jgi:hypothetical protein